MCELIDVQINDDRDTEFVSSGILPYMHTRDGALYILGKENFSHSICRNKKWSPFSGTRNKSETAEETAAREFCEETIFSIHLLSGDNDEIVDIENYLNSKMYDYKMTSTYRDGQTVFKQILFVCKVPQSLNQFRSPTLFESLRDSMINLKRDIKQLKYEISLLVKSCDYPHVGQYVKLDDDQINRRWCVICVKKIEFDEEKLCIKITIMMKHGLDFIERVLTKDVARHMRVSTRLYSETYNKWMMFINYTVRKFNEPRCLRIDTALGTIYNIMVKKEFLEKSKIQFFNREQINKLIERDDIKSSYASCVERVLNSNS